MITTSDTINISQFVNALMNCTNFGSNELNEDLEKMFQEYGLVRNKLGWEALCTHLDPYVIMKISIQTSNQLKTICHILDVEIVPGDDKEEMFNRVCARLVNSTYPFKVHGYSFASLHKYIKWIMETRQDGEANEAFGCAQKIEELLQNTYCLYGQVLYNYMPENERQIFKKFLRETVHKEKLTLGPTIDKLQAMENKIYEEIYGNAWSFLEEISGNMLIFEDRGPDFFDISRSIVRIRNTYFAHRKEQYEADQNRIRQKSREFFSLAEQLVRICCEFLPTIIFPVHFGINQWGIRYIIYIDEYNLDMYGQIDSGSGKINREDGNIDLKVCERFYFLREPSVFHPYQKAFCFYPTKVRTENIPKSKLPRIMYDPKIYYVSHLTRIPED